MLYLINKNTNKHYHVGFQEMPTLEDLHKLHITTNSCEVLELIRIINVSTNYYGIKVITQKVQLLQEKVICQGNIRFLTAQEVAGLFSLKENHLFTPICMQCNTKTVVPSDILSIKETGMCQLCNWRKSQVDD